MYDKNIHGKTVAEMILERKRLEYIAEEKLKKEVKDLDRVMKRDAKIAIVATIITIIFIALVILERY